MRAYGDDADGVEVVFIGFLKEMDGAKAARARKALDVAEYRRDGHVASCQRNV